jgi:hypothetical protein
LQSFSRLLFNKCGDVRCKEPQFIGAEASSVGNILMDIAFLKLEALFEDHHKINLPILAFASGLDWSAAFTLFAALSPLFCR